MHLSVRRTKKGFRGLAGFLLHGFPIRFDYSKKELIDVAFRTVVPTARSFADLGGVWGIDGAYTFYILANYQIESAFLVDTNFTRTVRERSKKYSNLALLDQNFGNPIVAKRIECVDAIILFDVLLHQVKPDWNEILEMYSTVTNCFIVYNQQFVASKSTVRLPELGAEKYFEHVPIDRNASGYRNLFEKPDEIHPQYNKPWRDIHNVWQWGITDNDLIETMKRLGFSVAFQKNHGQFSHFKSFENHAFVFLKTKK